MPFQGEQSDHLNKCHCDGFTFLKHWTKKESSLWLRKCPRQCTHQHKEKKSIQSKERNKSFVKGFILQLLHFPSPHSILLLFQTIPDPALRGCFVFFFFPSSCKTKALSSQLLWKQKGQKQFMYFKSCQPICCGFW